MSGTLAGFACLLEQTLFQEATAYSIYCISPEGRTLGLLFAVTGCFGYFSPSSHLRQPPNKKGGKTDEKRETFKYSFTLVA